MKQVKFFDTRAEQFLPEPNSLNLSIFDHMSSPVWFMVDKIFSSAVNPPVVKYFIFVNGL
jgi:hypothetical protein